jgi:hypothetical protein
LNGGQFVVVLKRKNMEHELVEEDSVNQASFQGISKRPSPNMFPIGGCKIHDMPRLGSVSRAPRLFPFLTRFILGGQVPWWRVLRVGDRLITIKICIPIVGMVEDTSPGSQEEQGDSWG